VSANWATMIAAISAFFSFAAAAANWHLARKASQNNKVNVYIAMAERYGTEEMRTALVALANLWVDHDGNIGEEALKSWLNSEELKKHCRIVNNYFENCAMLYEAGLISKNVLRTLVCYPGLNILYKVSGPILMMANPHHNVNSHIHVLKSVVAVHGDGKIHMNRSI
jgi:hypothetical protein